MLHLFHKIMHVMIIMLILSPSMVCIYAQTNLIGLQNEVRFDEKTKLPVALYNVNSRQYSGTPAEVAREYLLENKLLFKLKDNLDDLTVKRVKESPAGYHVGLMQSYNGIPVFRSETVVSINRQNRVSMVVNGYKPDISVKTNPAIVVSQALLLAKQAIGASTANELVPSKAELVIYQDSSLSFHLAWKMLIHPSEQHGEYLVFTDAHSGVTLEILTTIVDFVNGTGKVFNPDPGTELRDASLTDQNDADYAAIQPAYKTHTLNDLNDAVGGVYKVQGRYAKSLDISAPSDAVVTESNPANFQYNRSQNGFEEANIYYFIDQQRRYVGSLGFSPTWDYLGSNSQTMAFDARGTTDVNAYYNQFSEYMYFGVPSNWVDAGEDQSVILHEYGHAFHDALMYGGIDGATYGSDTRGISEGIGDYLGIGYRRTTQASPYRPNYRSNWFYPTAGESILSASNAKYPAPPNGNWGSSPYEKMNVWASTLMDIEYNTATDPSAGIRLGRDVTTTLLLTGLNYVTSSSNAIDNVNAIFQADRDIYDGSHLSTLATVFYNRGFFYGNEVSGTIASNTTWSGNKYVTGNVTVNSGVTLTISQNTFLFFASGTSLTVNGTLTANGSSTDKITFDFISPNSTTQNGIKINSGATINVSHAIIKNGWYGIYCNSTTSSPISYCEIMYCNTGIYFSSTNLGISNNYIHNNSMGIALYNSSPTLTLNKITGNTNYGVSSSGSTSIPLYGSGSTQGKNKISGNPVGVCAFSYSLPMLGNNSPTNGGYNTLGENTSYNIYAITSGVIYAINNYWGTIPPTASKIWINNGVILYSPYLYSDPTGLMKSVPINDDAVLALLQNAMILIEQKNFTTAREICLDIINNYPDSYAAFNALSLLSQDWNPNGKQANKDMLRTLFDKDKQKLNAAAGLMLAEFDKVNKLKVIEEVIGKFTGDAILEDALFSKFLYYNNDVKDKENARLVSVELDKLFPNSLTAFDAHSQLGDKDYLQKTYPFAKNGKEQKTNISVIPDRYELATNYPNPFNPTTTIDYQLLKDGLVTLKIYDILGNEVRTLVNENKEMGRYTVQFDASSLASGMYVYQLRVNDYTSTKKMLLLK